ncbi:TolC family protein (plasmid) [Cetobacterium somerae]|uniref:TolC family protein n=1 Tax=Cetobacterium somerae TaxID=188913 RepID=UPI002E7C104E|nr:TolC family protein [Cetobacterium somerae]WVJ03226.1 TolC family protein [Cetobacterium somerae]
MKKYILITLLLSKLIYSQEVSLDKLLNEINKTSYENQIYNIKNNQNNFKEDYYKTGRYNGVKVDGGTEYKDKENRYTFESSVSYGDFYVQGEKVKNDENKVTYGAKRSLKDLVFSKDDNELSKLKVTRDITKIDLKQGIESQKLSLINLYKDYKDNQFELKLKQNALQTLEKEKKVLEKSYQMGSIPKIDLDSLLVSYNSIKLEIDKIEHILEKIIERFYYDYGLKLQEAKLADIAPNKNNLEKYISLVGERDLKKLNLEKEITKENIKYLKYDNKVPEISVGVERNTLNDENRVFLKFSKDIFYKDIDLSNEESSLMEKEVTYNQRANEVIAERYKIQDNYYTLQKDYLVLENRVDLEKSKYEIKKLENTLGKVSYTEVMEAFDNYLELEVSKEKAKNSLNSYIYQIIVRSEI